MPLASGMRLGPYEVLEPIGAGGMGEVYRARDTKLERDVAIKVLPEEFASDPERLARFEREAKLLASLNHPNIAAIHGFEESDGVNALVLELVEGPTLAERIAQGRIPVDEAIAIAKQIAEALEAGHEAGVIHRDLKPANIKLKEDGTVKVLDYGLAKALEGETPGGADSELSQSPTLTRQTQVGVILGTAAYMSPEQAKGQRVDRKTDVWAFGGVLYEMLTGRKAFAGDDVADTLAAVLRAEPEWSALPPHSPEMLRRALRLCLAKDRKKRLQSVGDVRLMIESAFEGTSQVAKRSWSSVAVTAAFVLVGVVATILLMSLVGTSSPPSRVVRFSVPIPPRTWQTSLAVSPDGSNVAFVKADGIYLRSLDELEATRLIEARASTPVFSSDGQWLAFFERGQLKKVAVNGETAPIVLCDVAGSESGASWGDDDTIVFTQNRGAIYRTTGSGGEPEALVTLGDGELAELPQMLPGGDAILFTVRAASTTTWEESELVVQSLDSGERKVLVEGGRGGLYVPTGHVVFSRVGTLFAIPFDVPSLELGTVPVPLVEEVRAARGGASYRYFAVSKSGDLAFFADDIAQETTVAWMDRDGEDQDLDLPPRSYVTVELSPDGTRVALAAQDESNEEIWIHDLTQGATRRFTFDESADDAPLWTPDSERIIFRSDRDGGGFFWKRADGTGAVERLTSASIGRAVPYSVSPDGTLLVFNLHHPERSWDLKTVTLDDNHMVSPLLETPHAERRGFVSPDGRWIAYQSDEFGQDDVFVRPFPNVSAATWQVSTAGGSSARWARDGTALFYRSGEALMKVDVDVDTESIFAFSEPERILEAPFSYGLREYDVASDGKLLVALGIDADSKSELRIVLNWHQELKRLVPTQ